MGQNVRQDASWSAICADEAGEDNNDTNHGRGYVVNPTAGRNDCNMMTDEAWEASRFGGYYGECASGPFIKDAR